MTMHVLLSRTSEWSKANKSGSLRQSPQSEYFFFITVFALVFYIPDPSIFSATADIPTQ